MPSLATVQFLLDSVGLHYDVTLWLALFALVFARVTAAIVFAPFLGGKQVPGRIKVGLSFLLTVAILPLLVSKTTPLPASGILYLGLLIKEAVIGSMMGVLAQLVFYSVQLGGTIIDTQRGLNQVTFLAPQLEGHTSALGALQFQAALTLFFALGGHLMFLSTLMRSFRLLGILEIPRMRAGVMPVVDLAARTSADALLLGCQLAAPVVLALFVVDVAFSSAGRMASQIKINNEAFTTKGLLGLGFVCLLVGSFLEQLQPAFVGMLRSLERFIEAME
jgi:flagellar biosynthesis protein FliR